MGLVQIFPLISRIDKAALETGGHHSIREILTLSRGFNFADGPFRNILRISRMGLVQIFPLISRIDKAALETGGHHSIREILTLSRGFNFADGPFRNILRISRMGLVQIFPLISRIDKAALETGGHHSIREILTLSRGFNFADGPFRNILRISRMGLVQIFPLISRIDKAALETGGHHSIREILTLSRGFNFADGPFRNILRISRMGLVQIFPLISRIDKAALETGG